MHSRRHATNARGGPFVCLPLHSATLSTPPCFPLYSHLFLANYTNPLPLRRRRAGELSPPRTGAAALLVHGARELSKRYGPWFVWGQMSSWFKQVRGARAALAGACAVHACRASSTRGLLRLDGVGTGTKLMPALAQTVLDPCLPWALLTPARAWPYPTRITLTTICGSVNPNFLMLQTVLDPASALGSERRGALCLPDVESCFASRGARYAAKVR